MDLSVAQAPLDDPRRDGVTLRTRGLLLSLAGVALAVAAFAVYRMTFVERYYDHRFCLACE